ncbi:uncharacterized protein [Montipora foliosa]|uniref:uncharacterized protein n=1 Tax=Montipora foliosa TaxID=591990 RepID=UPI0035F1B854
MGPRRTSSQKPHRFIRKAKQNASKPKRNKSLKNKARDVQRLLKKPNLPATVRVEKERMLQMLRESIKDKGNQEKEKKIMERYKRVKFFEKRKLFRKYNICVKDLNECKDNETRDNLQKKLEEIKLQWNYIFHFPKDTKYISLFPNTSCNSEEGHQKQEHILKLISEKVSSGELMDASEAISQMGGGSKRITSFQLRLRKDDGKEMQAIESNSESEDDTPPMLNGDDDFFIDSSLSTVPPMTDVIEDGRMKKTKTKRKKLHQRTL